MAISIKLTNEQRQEIKKLYGHDVDELHLSVEEYGIAGAKESSMKVLKVSNVARVQVAGTANVVN